VTEARTQSFDELYNPWHTSFREKNLYIDLLRDEKKNFLKKKKSEKKKIRFGSSEVY